MNLVAQWKELAISPGNFDLIYVQFNSEKISEIPDKLKPLKNNPYLQGNALRAILCLSESVENLKNGFETNEHYLKHLRALVEVIPPLLEDESENGIDYNIVLKLNLVIAEFISIRSMTNHIASLTSNTLTKKKMLGDYLVENGYVRQSEVDAAIDDQRLSSSSGKRLGDILMDKGILTRAQLDEAIELQMLDNMELD